VRFFRLGKIGFLLDARHLSIMKLCFCGKLAEQETDRGSRGRSLNLGVGVKGYRISQY
jgi:hypothetical protein